MNKKLLVALALIGAVSTPVSAASWQMSAHDPAGNYHTKNAVKFAEQVEELSGGELSIDVTPNSVLLSRTELKRGVQRGIVPIGEVLISALGNEDPAYEADSIPMLATTFEQARRLWEASVDIYKEKLEADGLKLIYSEPWPPQGLYSNDPIDKPEDIEGMKLRAYNSTTARFAELLGAVPSTIASPEIPQAFATGMVSGMITSPTTGMNSQSWDYVKYYYNAKVFIPKNMVIANLDAFNGLSKETQDALMEAGAKAQERGWKMAAEAADEATATLADNGMTVSKPTQALSDKLHAAGEKMIEEWVSSSNEDVKAIVEAYRQ